MSCEVAHDSLGGPLKGRLMVHPARPFEGPRAPSLVFPGLIIHDLLCNLSDNGPHGVSARAAPRIEGAIRRCAFPVCLGEGSRDVCTGESVHSGETKKLEDHGRVY